jgi:hypothetical protein
MPDTDPIPLTATVYKTITKSITSFTVTVNRLVLNTSADLEIKLFGDNNEFMDFRIVNISGADYTGWGSDDNYIINYVKTWISNNYNPN